MTVRLPARADAVRRAIAAARRFTGEGEAGDQLAIVTEEWVANVVEHGAPAAGSLIVLRFEPVSGGVRLCASDAGVAFDPTVGEAPEPNLERGGGAGLALIRAWCRVRYRRRRGRNHVTLELA